MIEDAQHRLQQLARYQQRRPPVMQDLCNEDYNAGLKAGKQIVILAKDNYGRTMFYPVCNKSKLFAAIADRTTLSETNIRRIRQLGYEVTVTYPKTQTFDFTNP